MRVDSASLSIQRFFSKSNRGLDKNVPPQHGKWLAEHIPNSKLMLIDDESHIGLYINYEREAMQSAMDLLQN